MYAPRHMSEQSASLKLPSVRDLLHGPSTQRQQQQPPPQQQHASDVSTPYMICSTCMSRDRKVHLRPGESCPHCRTYPHDVSPSSNFPGSTQTVFTQHPRSSHASHIEAHQPAPPFAPTHMSAQTPRHSPSPMENAAYPLSRHPSMPNIHTPTSQYTYQPSNGSASFPVYQTPTRSRNPSMISVVSQSSTNSISAPLTAARIASNDRHKLSEKHRRDGMGAFVQAGHVLRSSLNPGTLFNCTICQEQAAQNSQEQSQYATPNSSFSSNPSTIAANAPADSKPKIPKNDMLNDSLLWEFGTLLHLEPEKVVEKVEGIKALALQMEEEKQSGIRNDWARRKKWSADVRGQVLLEVVARMEQAMRAHGIALTSDQKPWAGERRSVKRERERSDDDEEGRYGKRREADVPTPPSSRASPTL